MRVAQRDWELPVVVAHSCHVERDVQQRHQEIRHRHTRNKEERRLMKPAVEADHRADERVAKNSTDA